MELGLFGNGLLPMALWVASPHLPTSPPESVPCLSSSEVLDKQLPRGAKECGGGKQSTLPPSPGIKGHLPRRLRCSENWGGGFPVGRHIRRKPQGQRSSKLNEHPPKVSLLFVRKTSFLGLLDGVLDWTVSVGHCWGPVEGGDSVLTNVSTTTGTRLPRKPGGACKTSVEKRTARRRI